jgi:lipopolysaccharide/colanic/teichoic acid biosynthesis glycosyltransferase
MRDNCSEAVEIVLNQKKLTPVCSFPVAVQFNAPVPLWKRLLDLTVILLSVPVTISVGVVIALIIKLGSRGPVIFRQERVGYNRMRRPICIKGTLQI